MKHTELIDTIINTLLVVGIVGLLALIVYRG